MNRIQAWGIHLLYFFKHSAYYLEVDAKGIYHYRYVLVLENKNLSYQNMMELIVLLHINSLFVPQHFLAV